MKIGKLYVWGNRLCIGAFMMFGALISLLIAIVIIADYAPGKTADSISYLTEFGMIIFLGLIIFVVLSLILDFYLNIRRRECVCVTCRYFTHGRMCSYTQAQYDPEVKRGCNEWKGKEESEEEIK